MLKDALISLEVRKLIVKLRNEDKHSIDEIANIVKKSKSVITLYNKLFMAFKKIRKNWVM